MHSFFEGFFLQASLILALGAQNLFVLESALRKRRHILVAAICSLCDLFLIGLGVLGAASLFVKIPSLKTMFGILGVAFLFYFGILKLKDAIKGVGNNSHPHETPRVQNHTIVLTTLGFSLLNPHVYLDTLVLIGSYSTKFPTIIQRCYFGLGAGTFSVIWFFGLALLAAQLSRFLFNPRALRIISLISATILFWLCYKLGQEIRFPAL